MRSATATSSSDASATVPMGTGCSGSSGIWRSTCAVYRRISARWVAATDAPAGEPSWPSTSWIGDMRSV